MEDVTVPEEEKQQLLAQIRAATKLEEERRLNALAASSVRRQSIQAAMDAGISRQEIADAAGVQRVRLYQIIRSK